MIMRMPFSRTVGIYSRNPRRMCAKILLTVMHYVFSPSLLKRSLDYEVTRRLFKNAVRKVNYYRMVLSLDDKGISRELFLYEKREIMTTDYLLDGGLLSKGDVVLDIGANIGYYVVMESKLVGSSGKIYAVEPVSANIEALLRNIGINGCENVEVFQLAFGDKPGKSAIHVSDHANLCAIERNPDVTYLRTEEVSMSTVDGFLKGRKPPNLIRMDVEGYEYNILKGMKETLRNDVNLLIEVHGFMLTKKQLTEMFKVLEENSFRVKFACTGGKTTNRLADCIKRKLAPFPKRFPPTTNLEKIKRIVTKEGENGRPVQILFSKLRARKRKI